MNELKQAIYLKVNRREEYTFYNLKKWLNISKHLNSDVFVICDNQELQEDIFLRMNPTQNGVKFLCSYNTNEVIAVSKSIADDYWQNATCAQLTTFFHAKENGYKNFWNIDADDTLFCLETERCVEALKEVERYCTEREIKCASLDMWYSLSRGFHWSLGIVYIKDSVFWCETILKHYLDEEYENLIKGNFNLDCFLTYLRDKEIVQIESYYFENLEFVHYGNNMIMHPTTSWYCRWHDGKLIYPIICSCLGMESLGIISIHSDVICLDIGITKEEIQGFWASHVLDVNVYNRVIWESTLGNSYIENRYHLLQEKSKQFVEIHEDRIFDSVVSENRKQIIVWGYGTLFHRRISEIMKVERIQYVCDNNPRKWGNISDENIICISPIDLSEMKNVFVILCVENAAVCISIINQLIDMGITGFEHVDNWLEFLKN